MRYEHEALSCGERIFAWTFEALFFALSAAKCSVHVNFFLDDVLWVGSAAAPPQHSPL